MNIGDRFLRYAVLNLLVAGAGIWLWQLAGPSGKSTLRPVDVKLPRLSALAENGKSAFEANCAACHGRNAVGTDKGPPLVHEIYNPGHHSDGAFLIAAKIGVRQHHWPYGNMPPQPQVDETQLAAIVQDVRELQIANGIGYQPHRMQAIWPFVGSTPHANRTET